MKAGRPSARWCATAADVLEGAEVAGAGLTHEAARHQVVEGAQGLLDRRGAVGSVQLEEVDAIGAEAAQAALARGDDVGVGERARVARAEADLGREQHVVAPTLHRGTEDLLRLPVGVHVGGVDEVHARRRARDRPSPGPRARRRW